MLVGKIWFNFLWMTNSLSLMCTSETIAIICNEKTVAFLWWWILRPLMIVPAFFSEFQRNSRNCRFMSWYCWRSRGKEAIIPSGLKTILCRNLPDHLLSPELTWKSFSMLLQMYGNIYVAFSLSVIRWVLVDAQWGLNPQLAVRSADG